MDHSSPSHCMQQRLDWMYKQQRQGASTKHNLVITRTWRQENTRLGDQSSQNIEGTRWQAHLRTHISQFLNKSQKPSQMTLILPCTQLTKARAIFCKTVTCPLQVIRSLFLQDLASYIVHTMSRKSKGNQSIQKQIPMHQFFLTH